MLLGPVTWVSPTVTLFQLFIVITPGFITISPLFIAQLFHVNYLNNIRVSPYSMLIVITYIGDRTEQKLLL